MEKPNNLPYLIAGIKNIQLAISTNYAREIIRMPRWHSVPNLPEYFRGVINLRGRIIPLIDLRKRMGLPSALKEVDERVEMFVARERDHINWLQELENAIKEKRSFNLARDPCKCAFGKWYYSYKANDIGFASVMRKFEVPHRRIHEIADIVLGLAEKGDYQEAEKMIAHTREVELKRVIELFKEATNAFVASQKELAVVLSRGDKHISIAVDFVDAVESIDEKTIERVNLKNASLESDTTVSAARRTKDDGIVFLFDAGQVFDPTVSGLVGFASEDPPCVPPKTRIDRSKIPLPEF